MEVTDSEGTDRAYGPYRSPERVATAERGGAEMKKKFGVLWTIVSYAILLAFWCGVAYLIWRW